MRSWMQRRSRDRHPIGRETGMAGPRSAGLACLLAALALLFGLACAPPDSTSEAGSGETGSIGILVTDGPTDEFAAINLTVTGIELLGGPEGNVTVFSGHETFDLLRLRDVSELFSLTDDVPTGRYAKIRLLLEDIELVVDDGTGGVETHHPRLPGNGKLDLHPRSPFDVRPGEMLLLQIDIDAEKSIHAVQTGAHKYVFRPVVFVEVLQSIFAGRLVRVHGLVRNIEANSASFELCHLRRPMPWLSLSGAHEDLDEDSHPPIRRCIDVGLLEDGSLFDENGDPARLADMENGDPATVIGHVTPAAGRLQLLAELVLLGQRGTFTRLTGTVTSELDPDDRFDLHLDRAQGFVSDTTLAVQLFEGTRLFARSGMELSRDQIEIDLRAAVTGVIALSNDEDDLIKAAVLILDVEGPTIDRLRGVISRLDEAARRLEIEDLETSERHCVDVPERAGIFVVSQENGESAEVELGELALGNVADIYGRPGSSSEACFSARVIIAFPDFDPNG